MKYLFLLFFLPGARCTENVLKSIPASLTAWEGSCLVIPCTFAKSAGGQSLSNFSLIWYYDAHFNENLKDFRGQLLYNSPLPPEVPETEKFTNFQIQTLFVGDLGANNCSLKIVHLQARHSGVYAARLYASIGIGGKREKWLAQTTVSIQESPPQPDIEIRPNEIQYGKLVQVTCSMVYHCPDEPLTLTLDGLDKRNVNLQKRSTEMGKMQTELNFVASWQDDKKELSCSLKNQQGTLISQTKRTLDVKYAPMNMKVDAVPGTKVQEGTSLSLECEVGNSNPEPEYQWYKDGRKKPFWTDSTITLESIQEADRGSYYCEAKNEVGAKLSNRVTIDVQYSPKQIKVEMPTGPFKENDRVELSCSSRANPPITNIEWYKNSGTGVIAATGKLGFTALRPTDSGTYHCKATNSIGSAMSSPVPLDVQYAPKNVKLSSSSPQPLKESDTVVLNCSVGSSNPSNLLYKWYKIQTLLSHTLQLYTFPAPPTNKDLYSCKACNSIGCTSSNMFILQVLFAPKIAYITRYPERTIHEGNSVALECYVKDANPSNITYSWYKNGLRLNFSGSKLAIQKVSSNDSGNYLCEAQNSVGRSSLSVDLDVHYGPRNFRLSLPKKDAITEGMDVQLKCAHDAFPPAHAYKWYRDGEEMPQEKSPVLLFPKIQVKQSGCYYCRAYNAISEGESECMDLVVFYSRSTKMKHFLIGFGITVVLLLLLGLIISVMQRRMKAKKQQATSKTTRSSPFFVKKAKREPLFNNNNGPSSRISEDPFDFLNQGAETGIDYATLRFSPSSSKDGVTHSSVNKPNLVVNPLDETVVYSAISKPRRPPKGDNKPDYENLAKEEEEELHYSTLVKFAPRPKLPLANLETDSESEESIQYASLKH